MTNALLSRLSFPRWLDAHVWPLQAWPMGQSSADTSVWHGLRVFRISASQRRRHACHAPFVASDVTGCALMSLAASAAQYGLCVGCDLWCWSYETPTMTADWILCALQSAESARERQVQKRLTVLCHHRSRCHQMLCFKVNMDACAGIWICLHNKALTTLVFGCYFTLRWLCN